MNGEVVIYIYSFFLFALIPMTIYVYTLWKTKMKPKHGQCVKKFPLPIVHVHIPGLFTRVYDCLQLISGSG